MRLQRIGRRNDPTFRVIVADSRQGPKSGKHVDSIGSYNPKTGEIQINGEKAQEWISKGVQVSDTVHNMLVDKKIITGSKINVLPKKTPIIKEEPEEAPAETATDEAPASAEEAPAAESDAEAATEGVTEEKEEVAKETEQAADESEDTKTETPAETPEAESGSETEESKDEVAEDTEQTEPEATEEKTDEAEEEKKAA